MERTVIILWAIRLNGGGGGGGGGGRGVAPPFIKTPENIFSYGVSQYDKNAAYTMSFNVSEAK